MRDSTGLTVLALVFVLAGVAMVAAASIWGQELFQ